MSLLALATVFAATSTVFVPMERAAALVRDGAVVLDARGDDAKAPFLPGAQVVDWMDQRGDWGRSGQVAPADELRAAYAKLGVEKGRPVLVYGAARDGWGEEGRIWWNLRWLGHREVYILDGGIGAWARAKRPVRDEPIDAPHRGGRLDGAVQAGLRADADRVDAARRDPREVVLDTRTEDEVKGATPFWSPRGGRVPGSKHLYWKDLLAKDGTLRPKAEILKRLAQVGITPKTPVVAYCTGGVRSAFVVAVLEQVGVERAANYDGSWWDWSADDERPVAR